MILTDSKKNSRLNTMPAVLAVVGMFPNGTGSMLELLTAEVPALDWAAYCAIAVAEQESQEVKGDASTPFVFT